jgi:hypothetical protein
MKQKNIFLEKFESSESLELLYILENPIEFQEAAIEAAKQVLNDRQLTDSEVESLNVDLKKRKDEKMLIELESSVFQKKVGELINLMFGVENIGAQRNIEVEKYIKGISLVFTLISFYELYQLIAPALYTVNPLFSVVSAVYTVLATVLFWKRVRIGWLLLVAYISYSLTSIIGVSMMFLTFEPDGLAGFYLIVQVLVLIVAGFFVFLLAKILWKMCQSEFRGYYGVTSRVMLLTLGVSVFIKVVIMVFSHYLSTHY